MTDEYKTIARVLAYYIPNSQTMLDAVDAVFATGLVECSTAPDPDTHEGRVLIALSTPSVFNHMADGKKIPAIKELRTVTGCGLKEAKDAVEDPKVTGLYPRMQPGYST